MTRRGGVSVAFIGTVAVLECAAIFIATNKARAEMPEFHAFSLGFEFCAALLGSAGIVAVILGLFYALKRRP